MSRRDPIVRLYDDPQSGPELIVDSFAGGGGASTGIEMALGRSPDYAINHDAVALSLHAANHPDTVHLSQNIFKVDPLDVVGGRRVGLMWASPDCKHFSKAKGGAPVQRNIRDLAWVVVNWAKRARPRVIILENVEEFQGWGPLVEDADGNSKPCPDRKGETFRSWVATLRRHGYAVQWRELRACDYGAPTIRKRLFVIARRDGRPIVWPTPTHGKPTDPDVIEGRKRPWRTAAEIIDWSLVCPSIFDTAAEIFAKHKVRAVRPLKPATMARIAKGVFRYVINAERPFIVPVTHAGDLRTNSVDEPLRTQTTANRGEHALVSPFVTKFRQNSTGHAADEPLHTVTANSFVDRPGGASPLGVVAPFMVPRYGERDGQEPRTLPIDEPMTTVVPTGNGATLVAPHLMTMRNAQKPHNGADEPVHTLTAGGAHVFKVAAFLAQHTAGSHPGQPAKGVDEPVSTVTGKGCQQGVVAAHLLNLRGSDRRDCPADAPAPTVSAQGNHAAEVRAFLVAYYGNEKEGQACDDPMRTVTSKDRLGLVTVNGVLHQIVDIGMRMLTPRERFNAQGFPAGYRIDRGAEGERLTLEAQGRMVGNSVCPPLARALVEANCADLAVMREAAE